MSNTWLVPGKHTHIHTRLVCSMFIQPYQERPRVEDDAMMVSLNRPVSVHVSNGRCSRVYCVRERTS